MDVVGVEVMKRMASTAKRLLMCCGHGRSPNPPSLGRPVRSEIGMPVRGRRLPV